MSTVLSRLMSPSYKALIAAPLSLKSLAMMVTSVLLIVPSSSTSPARRVMTPDVPMKLPTASGAPASSKSTLLVLQAR